MALSTIGGYISSLLPSFSKARVEEDIKVLLRDIRDNTLPPYKTAAEHFQRLKFKSRDVNDFDRVFTRSVKLDREYKGNYISTVSKVLENATETLTTIENTLDKYFSKDIASSGLTYKRANMLRYIEVATFVNKYARKLLLWTYNKENTAYGLELANPFTKAEEEWLLKNRDGFLAAVRVLSIKSRQLEGIISSIPDMIIVPEEEQVVVQTQGLNAVDPLKMGLIPIQLNPIYHIRILVAEWQVARYESGVEERRGLEYHLLLLKEQTEGGTPDAKLEREIEYTQERIKKLNYRLAKMEEE